MGVVALPVKPPFVMPASCIQMTLWEAVPLPLIQFCTDAFWEAADDGSNGWIPATPMRNRDRRTFPGLLTLACPSCGHSGHLEDESAEGVLNTLMFSLCAFDINKCLKKKQEVCWKQEPSELSHIFRMQVCNSLRYTINGESIHSALWKSRLWKRLSWLGF